MMPFTLDKLKMRVPEIIAAAIRDQQPLMEVQTCAAPGSVHESAMAPPPPYPSALWRSLAIGDLWGGLPDQDLLAPPRSIGWGIPIDGGSNHWLRVRLQVPDEWRDAPVLLFMPWEGVQQASLEGIMYLDGVTLAGIDELHHAVLLPRAAHAGDHELLIRCYLPYPQMFKGIFVQRRDPAIFELGHMLRATIEALETYAPYDPARHALLDRMNRAYTMLDLREGWQSERFAASAGAALHWLREHLTAGLERGQRPSLTSTGHAHLDVAWLWPLWRTHQKVAHTVATALHLMERYPDYHFSMSQPQVYAFLKRDDPALYQRMKQRIAEGRFEPVGMMWLEPDCNIPSGESLVRQMAHGARFFADEFGVKNHVVWLPDVFGYSAALPQILRGCGVSTFMTTKISWNQLNRMPNDTFRWRGIDGTEVLTHFITATDQPVRHPADAQSYTYVGHMTGGEVAGTWKHYRQGAINDELLYIYGWGDGGGGPTEGMLEAARTFADLPHLPQVKLGRANDYFARLYERVWDHPELPRWVGELYLEYHRGTYTSQARSKQANRATELLLRETEWLNAWAGLHGWTNRQAEIDRVWGALLLNQFHDILPGSSVPQVYRDSSAQFAEIQCILHEIRARALDHLLPEGRTAINDWVVVNSLPWDRTDVVRLPENSAIDPHVPTQIVEEAGKRVCLVIAAVPAYSLAPLKLHNHVPSAPVLVTERQRLESDEFRLELDDHGEIASLYDRRYEREVIAPGTRANQLVAYEDRPLRWDAWDIDVFYEEKPYPLHEITGWRVLETGPIRSAIEIRRQVGQSEIVQRLCLWTHVRRIDFVTDVDWQARQMLLRALFPLNINTNRATCEIQFGAVERPTHRNTSWDIARFEVCAQRWVDLSEGDYGVALLNNGKYGHSLHDNVIGLSLLKGAIFPDPDADRGQHRFTYSLLPHAGDWRVGEIVRRAYELNVPLWSHKCATISQRDDQAHADVEQSFVRCDAPHVVVETIKRAHDGDGLIVRLYEAHNQRGRAILQFAKPIASAEEVDLLERALAPATVDGRNLQLSVRPFEIKAVRVRF